VGKSYNYQINPEVRDNGELFVVINIKDIQINSINELKSQIYNISKSLFILLSETITDVNSFALSFNMILDKTRKNIFIRSNKNEISTNKQFSPEEFIKRLGNKLIDDILK